MPFKVPYCIDASSLLVNFTICKLEILQLAKPRTFCPPMISSSLQLDKAINWMSLHDLQSHTVSTTLAMMDMRTLLLLKVYTWNLQFTRIHLMMMMSDVKLFTSITLDHDGVHEG